MKNNVIFICIHNSARSQMAEAYLKHFAGERFNVWSAGLEPGSLNPVVVEVMAEEGIDISSNTCNSVNEFTDGRIAFDYVVTVCDETAAEACPYFPGQGTRLHWGLPDPSSLTGSKEDKLKTTREIRDSIKAKVKDFISRPG